MNELVVGAWSMTETAGGHLAGVSLPLLLAGLAVHTLKLGARIRAWQNILRASLPGRSIRYRDAAAPYLAGLGASAVVPFGAGEVLRIGLARARFGSPDEHETLDEDDAYAAAGVVRTEGAGGDAYARAARSRID